MKDPVFDIGVDDYKKGGFVFLEDTTATPLGSFQRMRNATITQRGGIAPRPGTTLLGAANANTKPVKGLYNFRKSFGQNEILVKFYDDTLEFLSKDHESAGWTQLKTNYTSESEMGFVTSLVNTANQDYLVGGNRYEPYFIWTGAVALLSVALVGGETTVTVDTTLTADILEEKTATGSSATTLDVANTPWADDQWINFYVLITSGALEGKVRKITDNDNNTITFDTLGADPGLCTFEIRQLAFPASGTLVINGTEVAYSAIDTSTTFTTSAFGGTASSGVAVTAVVTEYPGAPRGNRFANYLTRIVVGNVRSAMTRGSGGALQGFSSAGAVFVSKLNDPTDFTYAATRSAGEGDLISMPYGGGDVTDVLTQEDAFYSLKERYIEGVKYSQDTNDLAVREPLKAGFGSIGKAIRGTDDIYFFTKDKQITSIGRVRLKDVKPQTLNIGNQIDRFLGLCGVDSDVGRGMQIGEKIYFPIKLSPDSTTNDIILIYNLDRKIFEGIWNLSANFIEEWGDEYYMGSSTGPDVRKLFDGTADVDGTTRFAVDFDVMSNFMNLTASKSNLQALKGIVIEGYVAGGARFTSKMWADFANDPFLQFDFSFDESGFLDGSDSIAFLAGLPLAIGPEAAVSSEVLEDGRRHFSFTVYFPFVYANYFAYGYSSNVADSDFEVTRTGLILSAPPSVNTNRIKYI